jgi:hypothetical protein
MAVINTPSRTAVLALALLVVPGSLVASGPQDPESAQITEEQEVAQEEVSPEIEGPPAGEEVVDEGDWDALERDPCALGTEGNWIDWMNEKVTHSVCGSARWFDKFFGTLRGDEDRDATFGRLGLGARWDQDDGADGELRFRAKMHFPNMDDRVNAVIGRGSGDEVLEDEGETELPQHGFFDNESEWLLGFGYHLNRSHRNRISLSVGSSFRNSRPDPYVRLRFISRRPLFGKANLYLRLVPQWQDSRGKGVTARVGIDRLIGQRVLLRWEASAKKFERRFDGVAYGTNFQVFQSIGVGRAMRYLVGFWGQSGFEHEPEDWGARVTFRDSIYKEILFIEVLGGVNFRWREGDLGRDRKYLGGLLFELKFGK